METEGRRERWGCTVTEKRAGRKRRASKEETLLRGGGRKGNTTQQAHVTKKPRTKKRFAKGD